MRTGIGRYEDVRAPPWRTHLSRRWHDAVNPHRRSAKSLGAGDLRRFAPRQGTPLSSELWHNLKLDQRLTPIIRARGGPAPSANDTLVTLEHDGTHYVAMARVVENMGIDWPTQSTKLLKQKVKFNPCDIPTVGADGKLRLMLCVPVKTLALWLATINPNKVRADLQVLKNYPDHVGVVAPLVYEGQSIHERGEMLNLTDMWTAARRKHVKDGGNTADFENRRPAQWLCSEDAKRFIGFLTETLSVGISHSDIIVTKNGGRQPGTFAHWQVGFAYAKYLSPKFHMWCATVARVV